MDRNVSIKTDMYGKKIVVIHDVRFKGKRNIEWTDVEKYLKQYVGKVYKIIDTQDMVYIGKELPDEYSGSKDTARLKGALAKAKANASQGIPELLKIASRKRFKENMASKHHVSAKFGWYRYDSRCALPVQDENGEIERYNIFYVEMLIRHASNGKMYLYDIINIKKETSTPL